MRILRLRPLQLVKHLKGCAFPLIRCLLLFFDADVRLLSQLPLCFELLLEVDFLMSDILLSLFLLFISLALFGLLFFVLLFLGILFLIFLLLLFLLHV